MIFKTTFKYSFLITFFAFSFSQVIAQTNESNEPHPPRRVSSGLGNSSFGNFLEFQFKPYAHDLMNLDAGYIPFSEIGKFNLTLRYYQNNNKVEVSKFSIIKLITLTPFNSLTESQSYGLDIGLESVTISERGKNKFINKDEKLRITPLNGEFLGGYSTETSVGSLKKPLVLSILGGIKSQIHPNFVDFIRIGPQAAFLIIYDLGNIKIQFNSTYQYYSVMRNLNEYSNSLKFRYSIFTNQEFRMEVSKMRFDQEILFNYI